MDRAGKAAIIEQLKSQAESASIAVVTDFKGMKVEELTDLRVKLRAAGVSYCIVKNTLARIAFTDGRHDVLKGSFKESCGVAFGKDDPVLTAKALVEFAKTSKKFTVRCGSLDGRFVDAEGLQELSRLPGRPELLARLLGTMNAVPTNFVGVLANVLRTFLYALNAIKDKKEAA